MKRLFLFLLALPAFAAGSVQQSLSQLGSTNNWVLTFRWTGDSSSGAVSNTAAQGLGCCQGYLVTQVETVPGSPAPTNGYSVQIQDAASVDVLDGAAASCSNTTAQSFAASSAAPPIQGTLTLVISGQSVAGAQGAVHVFIQKPVSLTASQLLGGGVIASTANWLTLANPPFVDARRYNFTAQSPGASLSAGVPATVTLRPCPTGVSGAGTGHYLYVSGGGGGAAEPVLITGGTCTGTGNGTVAFTPANSHTGGWTIRSATAGIQEALNTLSSGGNVYVPGGTYTIYATITLNGNSINLGGSGRTPTTLSTTYTAGPIISLPSAATNNMVHDLFITGAAAGTNFALSAVDQSGLLIQNFHAYDVAQGLSFTGPATQLNQVRDVGLTNILGDGVYCNTTLACPRFDNITVGSAGVAGTIAFHFKNGIGGWIVNSYSNEVAQGFRADPGDGGSVGDISIVNTLFEGYTANSTSGFNIVPTGTGNAYGIQVVQGGAHGFTDHGFYIAGTGVVDGVTVNQAYFYANHQNGILAQTGTNLVFSDCVVTNNSTGTPGTTDGMSLLGAVGTVSNVQVKGGTYGQALTMGNTQRYGIYLSAATSNVLVEGVNFTANMTGPISNSGTSNQTVNNIGLNPFGPAAIVVGASPFSYTAGSAPEMVYIYTEAITSAVRGGLTLCTASPCGVLVPPNGVLVVTYPGAAPTMVKDIQ